MQHRLFSELLKEPLLVIDAGGRGGFRMLPAFHSRMKVHSFEPDKTSVGELKKFYSVKRFAASWIHEAALSDSSGTAAFFRTHHPSMSSLLEPDIKRFLESYNSVNHHEEWAKNISTVEQVEVRTATIDSFAQRNNIPMIDLLKLDVQGGELKILRGSEQLLHEKKVGLLFCEVLLIPNYKSQPVFSDIDIFLRNKGYRFIDLRIYPDVLDKENSISLSGKLKERPKYAAGGDAVYIPAFDKSADPKEIKRVALLLSGLGYYSDSKTLLRNFCGMPEEEAEEFQRVFAAGNSTGQFKRFLKRWTPPAIANLYSRFKK